MTLYISLSIFIICYEVRIGEANSHKMIEKVIVATKGLISLFILILLDIPLKFSLISFLLELYLIFQEDLIFI